jgi:heme/copper-type cytochrome/quinol oxidase subunit 2
MTRNTRIGLLVAAALVVVVAVIVIGTGGGDGNDSTTAAAPPATIRSANTTPTTTRPAPPPVPVVRVRDGKAVGGVQTITVKRGERARFRVTSDAAHEIHLHGFDVAKDVAAGGSVTFDVKANAAGVYEFEIEETGTQIGQVKVQP